MKLNLPFLDQLKDAKNILIAGMGGGFDVFCGLPIYFELHELGFNVHLANYSFSPIALLPKKNLGEILSETAVGVHADIDGKPFVYFPELYLSQWFKQTQDEDITIWSFHKTGVKPLLENYKLLVRHLSIDTILLIDGGVDALNRGDELRVGTLVEDSVSLIAVSELKEVATRMVICVGLGAEQDMAYAHTMENIAALGRRGAFYGSCSLLKQMESYQLYENAVLYAQAKPRQDPSVINSSLISSVQGQYGDFHLTNKTRGSKLWISPLMSIYWFFDLMPIARRNMLYEALRWTETPEEIFRTYMMASKGILKRNKHGDMPI